MHYRPENMSERRSQHASVKEGFGFLWANPLGALIRIKCLSHLFSVAGRNNEPLNIVFHRNPSPSWPKDILRLFTLSLIPQQSVSSSQILEASARKDGQRFVKLKMIYIKVNQEVSIHTQPAFIESFSAEDMFFSFFFFLLT